MEETTIQYNHQFHLGRTYAVDVDFNKEDLLECVHAFDTPVRFKVGIAYLNPKDKHYNKKIGREVSAKALTADAFKLERIKNEGDKTFLYFKSEELELTFRVFKHSDKPHLIKVYKRLRPYLSFKKSMEEAEEECERDC